MKKKDLKAKLSHLHSLNDDLTRKVLDYDQDRHTERDRADRLGEELRLSRREAVRPDEKLTPWQEQILKSNAPVSFAFSPGKERLYDQVAAFQHPGRATVPGRHDFAPDGSKVFEELDVTSGLGTTPSFVALDEAEAFREQELDRKLLAGWWLQKAESEVAQTVAKAVEYGATDLVDIGKSLARVAGREVTDQEAAEWGIFFYLEGKLSRWRSALERGDRPSDDTLLDVGVYARMAQRNREAGGWPFGPDHYQEDQ